MKEIKEVMKVVVKGKTITVGIPELADIQQLLADYPTIKRAEDGSNESVDYENGEKSLKNKGWTQAMRNDLEKVLDPVWPKDDNEMSLGEFCDYVAQDDMFAIWLIYGDSRAKIDGLYTRAQRRTFRIVS